MKSGYTVQKLLEEFWVPSSSIFSKAIEFIPDRQNKDIEEKFKAILASQTEGFPKESIQSVSALKDTRLNELDEIWLDAIEEATSTLPELLILEQDESHFEAREGDSPFILMGKLFKKGNRSARKGAHATSNAFRRMFKKPEVEFVVATREVPFKSITQMLLFELYDQISDWKTAQFRLCARVFEVTQSWALTGKIDESSEIETTFQELISNLRKTYQDESDVHQKNLEQKFKELESKLKHSIELVGTIELPADDYDAEHIQKAKEKFVASLKVSSDSWTELIESLSQRVELLLHLVSFKEQVKYLSSTFLYKIEDFHQKIILDPHKGLKQLIVQAVEELNGLSKPTIEELSKIGNDIHLRAKETITKSISEPLNENIEQKYLSSRVDEFIEKMTGLSKDQPEKSIVIEDINLEAAKPDYEIKEIEWQKFVQRMLGKFIASELDSRKLNLEDGLTELSLSYSEVLQIIETNLVVIEEVSGKEEEEPITVALQGLERSLSKIEEIEEDVLSARDIIPEKVLHQNEELIGQLSGFLVKQDLSEMKWMETQLKVKASAGDWTTKFTVQWARFLDRLDLFQRFFFKKYRQNESAVRSFLGLKKPV